jgi:glutamine cyclotransferase
MAETRFVEGLEFMDEKHLLMSSGSYGNSHIDILDIETDPVATIKTVPIDSIYFGEGVTYLKELDHIIMLTYRKRKVFRYNSKL